MNKNSYMTKFFFYLFKILGNLFNINAEVAKTFATVNPSTIGSSPNNQIPSQKLQKNQRLNLYLQNKLNFIPEIVFGEDSPLCFIDYFNYIKYLPYGQIPDYRYLKTLFKTYLKTLKFEIGKFKYDWVQIMMNENVDLNNLSLSLTKANIDPFSFKKCKSKSDSEQNPANNSNDEALFEPEPFKLKLESTLDVNKPQQPKQRKSVLKFKLPDMNNFVNGTSEIDKKKIVNTNEIRLESKNEIKLEIKNENKLNGNVNNLNGYANGNGIHHDSHFDIHGENFNESIINEGKRLSEQNIANFK